MLACNVVCSLDGHACQATAEACPHAFRIRRHREREDRLLRKTIDVDIEEKSTGEQSDAEQSDGGQSLGGRAKRRRAGDPLTVHTKKAKRPPVRAGQAEEVAPGVLDQMREAHKREVDALQQSHAAELKRLEAASKTREDQWRAREAKWETERKSLQDRLLKAPKPPAGSAPVAGAHQRLNANGHPWEKPPGMHLCNVLWEIWWTDGDRPAVVTFSCHSEGKGGRHYLWIQGLVWAQMRAASLFA